MLIEKIVSGGQTGVDRGAIEAARELGFPYGGLIPKGRKAEDGIVPMEFDKMTEAARADYLFRTEWNVTHSDATLIISRYNTDEREGRATLTGGTLKTERFAATHGKPHLVVFKAELDRVLDWLSEIKTRLGKDDGIVLNVAGPRESKAAGIQAATKEFVKRILEHNQ